MQEKEARVHKPRATRRPKLSKAAKAAERSLEEFQNQLQDFCANEALRQSKLPILGVDIGTSVMTTGFCVSQDGQIQRFGLLDAASQSLHEIAVFLHSLAVEYGIQTVIVEEFVYMKFGKFFHTKPADLKAASLFIGYLQGYFGAHGIQVLAVPPRKWKELVGKIYSCSQPKKETSEMLFKEAQKRQISEVLSCSTLSAAAKKQESHWIDAFGLTEYLRFREVAEFKAAASALEEHFLSTVIKGRQEAQKQLKVTAAQCQRSTRRLKRLIGKIDARKKMFEAQEKRQAREAAREVRRTVIKRVASDVSSG